MLFRGTAQYGHQQCCRTLTVTGPDTTERVRRALQEMRDMYPSADVVSVTGMERPAAETTETTEQEPEPNDCLFPGLQRDSTTA